MIHSFFTFSTFGYFSLNPSPQQISLPWWLVRLRRRAACGAWLAKGLLAYRERVNVGRGSSKLPFTRLAAITLGSVCSGHSTAESPTVAEYIPEL
jgi:hypothetical protein